MRNWFASLGLAWSLALLPGIGMVAHADEPGAASDTAASSQTYHSDSGGFSVSVPVNWVASEQTRVDGTDVTSLAAPDDTVGVMIVVHPSAGSNLAEELPDTLCQPIMIGGQPGTRCLDTLSSSSTVSVQISDRLYQILAPERQLTTGVYAAVLASFGFDQTAVSPASAPPPPTDSITVTPPYPRQYGCGSDAGVGKAKPLCAMP